MLDCGLKRFGREYLPGWPGRTLVIGSEHERAFTLEALARRAANSPLDSI